MTKLFLTFGIIFNMSCNAQKISAKENEYISLTRQFISYIKDNPGITDSAHIKFILLHYIFVDKRLDSTTERLQPNELTNDQLVSLRKQLHSFSDFIQKNDVDAIDAKVAKDTYIYNNLTTFQKENTVALIDKRFGNILAYILIMPPKERVLSTPRIWSWTLTLQQGKYMFRSVTGEDGYEYIFN